MPYLVYQLPIHIKKKKKSNLCRKMNGTNLLVIIVCLAVDQFDLAWQSSLC